MKNSIEKKSENLQNNQVKELPFKLGDDFYRRLKFYIEAKEYTEPQLYSEAQISKKTFSLIRKNKNLTFAKVTALAITLELDLKETIDLLRSAGIAFCPSNPSHLFVKHFIKKEMYDINKIDRILVIHGLPEMFSSSKLGF